MDAMRLQKILDVRSELANKQKKTEKKYVTSSPSFVFLSLNKFSIQKLIFIIKQTWEREREKKAENYFFLLTQTEWVWVWVQSVSPFKFVSLFVKRREDNFLDRR